MNTGNSTPGTTSYTSNLQETDCYDYLAFSFDFSGSTGTTTFTITWFDQAGNNLFSDIVTSSAAALQQFQLYTIKGYKAQVTVSGSGGSFVFEIFANLVRQ